MQSQTERQHQLQNQQAEARIQQEEAAAALRQQEAQSVRVEANLEAENRRTLYKISQFIWLCFGILEGLIGLRILLKLMAANPDNPFARLIYGITDVFLWPFVGLTATPAANGVVLEIHSIVALFVYALISLLADRLIRLIFSRPRV